jgi:hypothetical protein
LINRLEDRLFAAEDRYALSRDYEIWRRPRGIGRVYRDPRWRTISACDACRGTGAIGAHRCDRCGGRGTFRTGVDQQPVSTDRELDESDGCRPTGGTPATTRSGPGNPAPDARDADEPRWELVTGVGGRPRRRQRRLPLPPDIAGRPSGQRGRRPVTDRPGTVPAPEPGRPVTHLRSAEHDPEDESGWLAVRRPR